MAMRAMTTLTLIMLLVIILPTLGRPVPQEEKVEERGLLDNVKNLQVKSEEGVRERGFKDTFKKAVTTVKTKGKAKLKELWKKVKKMAYKIKDLYHMVGPIGFIVIILIIYNLITGILSYLPIGPLLCLCDTLCCMCSIFAVCCECCSSCSSCCTSCCSVEYCLGDKEEEMVEEANVKERRKKRLKKSRNKRSGRKGRSRSRS